MTGVPLVAGGRDSAGLSVIVARGDGGTSPAARPCPGSAALALHIPAATRQHRTLAQTETVRVPEDAEHIDVHHNPRESAAEAYPDDRQFKCRALSRGSTAPSIAANIPVGTTLFSMRRCCRKATR